MKKASSIVDYALKYPNQDNDINLFVEYLLNYPSLRDDQKDIWNVIQFFVTDLANSRTSAIQLFREKLATLAEYYARLCVERSEQYDSLGKAHQYTANLIFQLSKCYTKIRTEKIPAKILISLLVSLIKHQEHLSSFSICNAVRGTAYMASRGFLKGKIKSSSINHLLKIFSDRQFDSEIDATLSVIEAMVLLCGSVHFKYKIDAIQMNKILDVLIQKKSDAEKIYIALLSIEKIALNNNFFDQLDSEVFERILYYFLEYASEQQLILALSVITKLTQARILTGKIDACIVDKIMTILLGNIDNIDAIVPLLNLRYWVINQNLSGEISPVTVNNLIGYVIHFASQLTFEIHYHTYLSVSYLTSSMDCAGNLLYLCSLHAPFQSVDNSLMALYGLMRCNASKIIDITVDDIARCCFKSLLQSMDLYVLENGDAGLTSEDMLLLATAKDFYLMQCKEAIILNAIIQRRIDNECAKYSLPKISVQVTKMIRHCLPDGVNYASPHFVGGYVIDTALQYADTKVAVVCDGNDQCVFDPMLRAFVLNADNWIEVIVIQDEWMKKTEQQRKEYIEKEVLSLVPRPKCPTSASENPQWSDLSASNNQVEVSPILMRDKRLSVSKRRKRKIITDTEKPKTLAAENPRFFHSSKPAKESTKPERCCFGLLPNFISRYW